MSHLGNLVGRWGGASARWSDPTFVHLSGELMTWCWDDLVHEEEDFCVEDSDAFESQLLRL